MEVGGGGGQGVYKGQFTEGKRATNIHTVNK